MKEYFKDLLIETLIIFGIILGAVCVIIGLVWVFIRPDLYYYEVETLDGQSFTSEQCFNNEKVYCVKDGINIYNIKSIEKIKK